MKKIVLLLLSVLLITGCSPKTVSGNETSPDEMILNIEGDLYEMPIKVSDLMDKGWETSEKPGKIIKASDKEYDFVFSKDDKYIITHVENLGWNEAKVEDSHVTRIYMGGDEYKKTKMASIILANDITIESKLEDVKKAFSLKKSDAYEKNGIYSNMYSVDLGIFYDFEYDTKDDEMIRISIVNSDNESFRKDSKEDLDLETPSYITDYKLPKTLSTKIEDGMFTIDSVVYELGMPLSLFLESGWEVEYGDEIVAAESNGYVSVTKGKFELDFTLYNPDSKPNTIENTLVKELGFFNFENDHDAFQMLLGMGITPLSTYEEVLTILGPKSSNDDKEYLSLSNDDIYIYVSFTDKGTIKSIYYELERD